MVYPNHHPQGRSAGIGKNLPHDFDDFADPGRR
jgi:hypothetical protein